MSFGPEACIRHKKLDKKIRVTVTIFLDSKLYIPGEKFGSGTKSKRGGKMSSNVFEVVHYTDNAGKNLVPVQKVREEER